MLTFLLLLQAAAPQRPAQLTQFLQQSIGFEAAQVARRPGSPDRGAAAAELERKRK